MQKREVNMRNSILRSLSDVMSCSAEGVLIKADSADVLPKIEGALFSKVKCIYLDPPYRNGDTYSHYSDAASHEDWINDMAMILPHLYNLLLDDGSLWISIDDSEMPYLKVLCDTLFGRQKYVSTIVWEHRTSRENRRVFSNNHEYLLVYAKNPEIFKKSRNLMPAKELQKSYKNPDSDPRGPWQSITATAQAGHAVASQFYVIKSPLTGKEHHPPKGRCWVYNETRMLSEIESNNIWFGADGNGVPRIKKFLTTANLSVVPETLWKAKDVGTTKDAKRHVLNLSENEIVFETPKPETLVKRIFDIATNENDIVMDAFLGSGTTAAVAHKMGRRYIGIERSESSFKCAINRMNAVVDGEQGGISRETDWKGGGSFLAVNSKEKIEYSWEPLVITA